MHCDYFETGLCRSCTWLETPYETQLAEKHAAVTQALQPAIDRAEAYFSACADEDTFAMPGFHWLPPQDSREDSFRNKAKMAVTGTKTAMNLGLAPTRQQPGGVDLLNCPLHEPAIQCALPIIRAYLESLGTRPYQIDQDRGELKHVLVTANPDGYLSLRLVLRSKAALPRIKKTWSELRQALPRLQVFAVNIQPRHAAVLEGTEEIILSDEVFLPLPSWGATLLLAPGAFFQTNTDAALRLYEQARTWTCALQPKTIWDLYCGVGGFSFATATVPYPTDSRGCRGLETCPSTFSPRVTGVEISGASVSGARAALEVLPESSRPDITFIEADATQWATAQTPDKHPELVIVNPPRRGLGPNLCNWLNQSKVRHLIYSSCNPATLAADLERLPSFVLREAKIVDMFPQTAHVETVVLLNKVQN